MRRSFFALVLLLGASAPTSEASAQCEPEPEPPDAARAIARANYTAGVEASTEGRWVAARQAFERAYAVAPFAPVAYNLATAQGETGQIVEASESYRRFLRRCSSRDTPDLQADARELLRRLTPRIAHLTIVIEHFDVGRDHLEVDGEELAGAVVGAEIPFNPGPHSLRVLRRREEAGTADFTLAEGQHQTVEVDAPTLAFADPEPGDQGTGSRGGGGGGLDDGALAGILVGVGLAIAAAVVITVVVLTLGAEPAQEPVSGTWEPARLPLVRF